VCGGPRGAADTVLRVHARYVMTSHADRDHHEQRHEASLWIGPDDRSIELDIIAAAHNLRKLHVNRLSP
jgi:hypothetical protein